MSYRIVKQPDGGLAVWSTITDDFVLTDAEQADIVDLMLEFRVSFWTRRVADIVASLERGGTPYGGHTSSWDELCAHRLAVHGEPFDLEKVRAEEGLDAEDRWFRLDHARARQRP